MSVFTVNVHKFDTKSQLNWQKLKQSRELMSIHYRIGYTSIT